MNETASRQMNTILIAAGAIALTICGCQSGQQNGLAGSSIMMTDGLVALYPMDGRGNDVIGGSHGELVGTTPSADRFGRPGQALAFNGIGDEMVIAKPPSLNREGSTIALWVKFREGGENIEWQDVFDGEGFSQPIVSQDDGNGIRVFLLCLWKGSIRSNGQGCGWSLVPDDREQVQTGRWYHVAMVRDGRHRLFLDGKLVQEKPDDVFNICQCQPWLIGATRAWGKQDPHLNGDVDDVRVYRRALSEEEIHTLAGDTDDAPAP